MVKVAAPFSVKIGGRSGDWYSIALIGLGQDSVSKWRSRFIKTLPHLQEVAEKDPSHLEETVSSFLNDCPRPGSQEAIPYPWTK